jgi:hypothetical protein
VHIGWLQESKVRRGREENWKKVKSPGGQATPTSVPPKQRSQPPSLAFNWKLVCFSATLLLAPNLSPIQTSSTKEQTKQTNKANKKKQNKQQKQKKKGHKFFNFQQT